jgi:hypothetical protein
LQRFREKRENSEGKYREYARKFENSCRERTISEQNYPKYRHFQTVKKLIGRKTSFTARQNLRAGTNKRREVQRSGIMQHET